MSKEEFLGSFQTSMTEFFEQIAQQIFDRALNISLGLSYEKPTKVDKVDSKSFDHILEIEVSRVSFPVRFEKYLA